MGEITRRGVAAAPVALAAGPALAQPGRAPGWTDATETAARIRRREISAEEAMAEAIDRAQALQGPLNFIVNSDFDRALAKAKAKVRAGRDPGPFAGVPFLVKDLEDYAGLPTRYGSAAGRHDPPASTQGPYADMLDRAGLVVIGKSATSEYGFLPTTEPLATGPTRNPWDPTRSCGGSSGGAAAAVAAGVVPFAHASDGGGSIRIPASCCGLFGLKPSRGRMVGARGDLRLSDLSVSHCLSRTVRDSAALFAATEDRGGGARYPQVGLVTRPGRRRLRIGYLLANSRGHAPSPAVADAAEDAARLLDELGHRVEPTQLPFDGPQFDADFRQMWTARAGALGEVLTRSLGRRPDRHVLEPFSLALIELAAKSTPAALQAALARLEANVIAYEAWFASRQFDVVLSPVVSAPPPQLGELAPAVPVEVLAERLAEYVGYTPLHNVAGAPSMSVPLSWSPEGLPVGAMFSARAGAERTLFELAYELEAAKPWVNRRPPIAI